MAEKNDAFTPITITVEGEKVTKYIASDGCISKDSDFLCPEGKRGYIHNTPTFDTAKPDYFFPSLLGKKVEWDVDLSKAECGCIHSFYSVSMPGYDEAGALDLTDGYGYCDSNYGHYGGQFCPEFDFMEANKYAFQTTPHVCDKSNWTGHYASCDGHGANINSVDELGDNGYGPGSQYTIDTTKPFHVKVELFDYNDEFGEVLTMFSQEGRCKTMRNRNSKYLNLMTEAVDEGQVFVLSSWKATNNWLTKQTCDVEADKCSSNPTATISNISISTSNGASRYGDECPGSYWKPNRY